MNDINSESNLLVGWFFLRLSDEETEGIWKDPDGKENLTFSNWQEHPNDTHHYLLDHAIMSYDGKWREIHETFDLAEFVLCEFT